MGREYLWMSLFAVAIFSVFLVSSLISNNQIPIANQELNYQSVVCVYKNGEQVGDCSHNTLFNLGANMTRDILGNGASYGAFSNISLCNSTTGSAGCATPTAAATETFTPFTGCGLTPSTGTYAAVTSSPGNWTISKTFTSTCDAQSTNVTRLGNSTAYFAGNSFTAVTLQTNDQLTINWSIWIS